MSKDMIFQDQDMTCFLKTCPTSFAGYVNLG